MARLDFTLSPKSGWREFQRTEELTAWLWDQLSNWHYMNLTSNMSAWENREDASMVYISYVDSTAQEVEEFVFLLDFGTAPDESSASPLLDICQHRFELLRAVLHSE